MSKPDLQALADMPGYGKADEVLVKMGHPKMVPPPQGKRFVMIEWSVSYLAVLEVDADDDDEAIEAAEEIVRSGEANVEANDEGVEIHLARVVKEKKDG